MSDTNRFKQALNGNGEFLEDRLDIESGLLTRLQDSGVLNDRQVTIIKAQGDKYAQVAKLVDFLKNCNDDKFDTFIEVLKKSSQDDVAKKLGQIVDDTNLKSPHQEKGN